MPVPGSKSKKKLIPKGEIVVNDKLVGCSLEGKGVLFVGDCVEIMQQLEDEMPSHERPKLAFADPPFNLGIPYDQYDDKVEDAKYLEWCLTWMAGVFHATHPLGSFFLACHNSHQARLRILAESVGYFWLDTLCWHYTFGPNQRSKLTPSWVPIHWFVKDRKRYTFNQEEVRVPSKRQLVYGDKRAKEGGKTPDNVWVLLPEKEQDAFRADQNSILQSRVCGTFKERTGHPCQMPVPVLDRIVRMASKPWDKVLDPFLGSGTTGEAALRNGRQFIGIELSDEYVRNIAYPRLKDLV